MTTSIFNRYKRHRLAREKVEERRRERRTGGDFRFQDKNRYWKHPNWQYNLEEQGKDKR